jgi:hypothetical protein
VTPPSSCSFDVSPPSKSSIVAFPHLDSQVKVIEGEQHYKKTGKSGVGLFFLEEDSLFIVRNIVEGGSAWRDGTIKMSDICVAVDGISMEDRGLQDLRNAVIGAEGTMVTLTFHRIVDQSRTVFKVVLRRGQGLVEENARLSLELSSALQVISSLEQGGRDALADDAQMQMLRQQLDAQSEELLYCRRQRTINEAQNVLTSQTIQNLEDKVLLSNTQYAQLLETHQALELRFELDSQQHLKQQQQLLEELQSVRQSTAQQIDSVQQAAALQLERCSQDARASSLQLQSKLQDQKKHDELQQQLQQQLAESNSQLKAMSLKLVQMGDQVRRFEAQVASQSASIESERQSTAQLLSHMQVQEKSLGEARAMLSSLSTDNARLDAELHLSREALDASHIRERELIVRSETSCNDAIAEAASRARVAAEQHRLSQGQIEALQKQLIDAQFQQQDARRLADAAAGAEREASSRASIADAEILQLRRRVIELDDAAASATSSSETASTRAVRLERQVGCSNFVHCLSCHADFCINLFFMSGARASAPNGRS